MDDFSTPRYVTGIKMDPCKTTVAKINGYRFYGWTFPSNEPNKNDVFQYVRARGELLKAVLYDGTLISNIPYDLYKQIDYEKATISALISTTKKYDNEVYYNASYVTLYI